MRLQQYIRLDGRDPEGKEQRAVIAKFKPEGNWTVAEYVEPLSRAVGSYPQRDKLVRAIRSSSDIVVVADFWRLASRLSDLTAAVDAIRAKQKPVIVEARTGKRSDCAKDLVSMCAHAANVYAGRMLSPERAKALGDAGAEASPRTKPKPGRAPWKVIVAALRANGTVNEAIAFINGLGHETPINRIWLYREAKNRKTTVEALRTRRGRTT